MLIASALASSPAAAHVDRALSVCMLTALPGMEPRALLRRSDRFDCDTPQRRWGPADYWLLSEPLPTALPDGDLAVQSTSLWQDRTTLYVLYADGTVRRTGFSSAEIGDHLHLAGTFTLSLPRAASPPRRLLWHIEGAANMRGVLLGAMLRDRATTTNRQVVLAAVYGAFIGLSIALIVYNLGLWGALRQRFQIIYCVLVCFSSPIRSARRARSRSYGRGWETTIASG